jgi:hypothetical protein
VSRGEEAVEDRSMLFRYTDMYHVLEPPVVLENRFVKNVKK